jgi:DNA-binding Lrp family transcriptional regulator
MIAIKNKKMAQALLSALADQETRAIMDAAIFRAKSFNEIVKETGVPHSTAFRKIKTLLNDGVMIVERIEFTPDGKKYSVFRSSVRSINVKYELGEIIVEAEENVSALSKVAERFFSIDI